jgi:hypothetical protein
MLHAGGGGGGADGGGNDAAGAAKGDADVNADAARRKTYDFIVVEMPTKALLPSDADLRLVALRAHRVLATTCFFPLPHPNHQSHIPNMSTTESEKNG